MSVSNLENSTPIARSPPEMLLPKGRSGDQNTFTKARNSNSGHVG